jgi:hypothetical protein
MTYSELAYKYNNPRELAFLWRNRKRVSENLKLHLNP